MPKWSSDIPQDPRGQSFPIMRTPTAKPLGAVITCADLVGTYTHFYKGRTVPCEGDHCDPDAHALPYRWHAYLSAYQVSKSLHFLFECTAQAAEPFIEYRAKYASLRGAAFEATRYNSKPNGRILIRCRPADLSGVLLPQPPDLIKALSILWNLPVNELSADRYDPEKETKNLLRTPKGD